MLIDYGGGRAIKRKAVTCPHCPDSYVVQDHEAGESRCNECGEVVAELIDDRTEHRTFEGDSADKGRHGQAESEFSTGGGMGATIKTSYGADMGGRVLQGAAAASSRAPQQSSTDERIRKVHSMIGEICTRLRLSKQVRDTAKRLAFNVEIADPPILPVGRNLPARASACTFAACKIEGTPRTLKEILGGSESSVTKKDLTIVYKRMEKARMWEAASIVAPDDLVPRFADRSGVPQALCETIKAVASKSNDLADATGGNRRRQPASDAAGAILYVVEREQRLGSVVPGVDEMDTAALLERLQQTSGQAATTIRAAARDFESNEALLFPPDPEEEDDGDGDGDDDGSDRGNGNGDSNGVTSAAAGTTQ